MSTIKNFENTLINTFSLNENNVNLFTGTLLEIINGINIKNSKSYLYSIFDDYEKKETNGINELHLYFLKKFISSLSINIWKHDFDGNKKNSYDIFINTIIGPSYKDSGDESNYIFEKKGNNWLSLQEDSKSLFFHMGVIIFEQIINENIEFFQKKYCCNKHTLNNKDKIKFIDFVFSVFEKVIQDHKIGYKRKNSEKEISYIHLDTFKNNNINDIFNSVLIHSKNTLI